VAPWALLLACAAPVCAVALLPGLDLWQTDDGTPHLLRVFALERALGQFWDYPRWIPDLYRGYGYPVFNYYPPLAYYAAEALHRLGPSIYSAYRALAVAAVLLGASGTFVLVRHLWPARDIHDVVGPTPITQPEIERGREGGAGTGAGAAVFPGVLAAAVYVAAPYPFLTNLFLRGDLPEALCLGVLPWFLLAVHRAYQAPPSRRYAATAPAAALGAVLLLTHSLSALLAAAFGAAWIAAQALAAPRRAAEAVPRLAFAGLVAFGVAAFACLPALTEGAAVQLDLAQHPVESVLAKLSAPFGDTRPATQRDRQATVAQPGAVDCTRSNP
jgi:uncharacterized membrane protein